MDDIVIQAEGLGKEYRIGAHKAQYDTLVESLNRAATAPFRRIARLIRRGDSHSADMNNIFWALKDVSFEVRRGEVLGIIGRNGAGKTTLLKILSRITAPTEGYAEIRGRVGSLLEVGTGFHPELTGRENIYLNGAILGMRRKEIDRKFADIVAFSEVEKFLDTQVKHYSSGMYVRLAFAVAAHLDPEVLMVDEVLAVGDYKFQEKCLGKMKDVTGQGKTVLFVSHNMAAITNLCERAILVEDGRIVMDGQAASVVERYLVNTRSTGGEVVWPTWDKAPGNDIVRLHAVRVLQEGVDGPATEVDISKEVIIQISYWNLREGASLYRAIILKDRMGTIVLASSNHRSVSLTEDPWYGRPQPAGLFQSVCRIPGNLLNDSTYSVSAFVGSGASHTEALADNAVTFQVHDTGAMRKEFYGGWAGVVRPRLAWSTELLSTHGFQTKYESILEVTE